MNIKLLIQGLALATTLASTHFVSAASYDLCVGATTKIMPDASTITMWGYAIDPTPLGTTEPCPNPTVPGPQLDVLPGDTSLTINLRNTLPGSPTLDHATSIIIPGLSVSTYLPPTFLPADVQGRVRARAMTQEAGAGGGKMSYSFTAVPGTYLYQSGSHPAVQVQMGLYGGVVSNAAVGKAYPDPTTKYDYDNEVVLLYSEIDPELHTAVATETYGTALYESTINYTPKYFLVNGAPYSSSTPDISAGVTGETTLVRFLNAGLESHAPAIQSGTLDVIAEYGSPYPFIRKNNSFLLAAGQTKDVLFQPEIVDRYAIYDRRLRLTNNLQSGGGLMSFLNVNPAAGNPIATLDSAVTDEDISLLALDLAINDTAVGGSIDLDSIHIPFKPVNGTVIVNNDGTGTVVYTPNVNFNGIDKFNYTIRNASGISSNMAEVTVTVNAVNDGVPVAVDDGYTMDTTQVPMLSVSTPGVLGNDTDIDLEDSLTAVLQSSVSGGGLTFNADGSFDYTPNVGTTSDSFTYVAFDGTGNSNLATVSINIDSPPVATTLISPTGNIVENTPTYIWNKIDNATDYRLIVWDPADPINRLVDMTYATVGDPELACIGTICEVTPPSIVDGSYRYRVRTKNVFGWGPWSNILSFTVGVNSIPPVATTLVSPTGNVLTDTPTYIWNETDDTTDYRLIVWDPADQSNRLVDTTYATVGNPELDCNGTTCQVTPSIALVVGSSYRFRVKTKNAFGWGPWSNMLSPFNVVAGP